MCSLTASLPCRHMSALSLCIVWRTATHGSSDTKNKNASSACQWCGGWSSLESCPNHIFSSPKAASFLQERSAVYISTRQLISAILFFAWPSHCSNRSVRWNVKNCTRPQLKGCFDTYITPAYTPGAVYSLAYGHLRQLRPITRALSVYDSKTLVHTSACNSLLFSSSDSLLRRLQAVQNAAARLVSARCVR